jgi:hypothetical protein
MADAKQRNAQIKKRKQLLNAFISVLVENTDRISNFFVGDLMVLLDLVTRIGVKKIDEFLYSNFALQISKILLQKLKLEITNCDFK